MFKIGQKAINEISSVGTALGAKKWMKPSNTQLVLNLELDSLGMCLRLGELKVSKMLAEFKSIINLWSEMKREHGKGAEILNTLKKVQLLGKMVPIELAVPSLLLYSRPLFQDLHEALLRGSCDHDSDEYIRRNMPLTLRCESIDTLKLLIANLAKIDDQPLCREVADLVLVADTFDDS